MKRVEIIANQSIEEDLFDFFAREKIVTHYTLVPEVKGAGDSNPKKGDSVWPENNFLLIIYCEDDEFEKIVRVLRELKLVFPGEGIKMFVSDAHTAV